jgi:hypothetical protein
MRRFRIMHNTGDLKGHDVKMLCMGLLRYLFDDRLESAEQEAMNAIFDALEMILDLTCNADDQTKDHDRDFERHRSKMAEYVCIFERGSPQSEMCVLVHELLHFPPACYRWNAARNFWVFFSERYIDTIIHNIVHAWSTI